MTQKVNLRSTQTPRIDTKNSHVKIRQEGPAVNISFSFTLNDNYHISSEVRSSDVLLRTLLIFIINNPILDLAPLMPYKKAIQKRQLFPPPVWQL